MSPLTRKKSSLLADLPSEDDQNKDANESTQATPLLSTLPPELRKTIVEYLSRPSDKKSLCLVSKDFHALTLPYLYQDVVLPASVLNDRLVSAFASSHPGLPYIRALCVKEYFSDASPFEPVKHLPILYNLLTVIPKDSLRIFELCTTASVNERLGLLLRIRQQRLMNHQYLSLQSSVPALIPLADEVSRITCLQLFLKNRRDCRNSALLLARMTSLTSLSIKLECVRLDHRMGGSCATGREVINTLFAAGYATAPRAKLRHLRIESMSFHSAGAILPTVLPLDQLEHLHLFRCSHTGGLYESLSQLNLTMRSLCDERYSSSNGTLMDTFLGSLAPLEKLRVTCACLGHGYNGFAWSTILPHAHELRCLEMGDHKPSSDESFMDMTRTLPEFRAFCKQASHLQQLSTLGPSIESATWKSARGLNVFLDCLRDIRTLRLLKLSVHPDCLRDEFINPEDDDDNDDDDDDEAAEVLHDLRFTAQVGQAKAQAQLVVDHIFQYLAPTCPHLAALVITLNCEDGFDLDSIAFLRLKQTDLFGNSVYVGIETEEKLIKFYEPCSDVLYDVKPEDLLQF